MKTVMLSTNPYKIFENQSPLDRALLGHYLSLSVKGVYLSPSHEQSAHAIGKSEQSVKFSFLRLEKMGFIEIIKRRFNSSNIFKLTDFFYRPDVQRILHYFFSRFPRVKFTLETLLGNFKRYIKSFDVSLLISTILRRSCARVTPEKKSRILNICAALEARGAKPTENDAYCLAAYSNKVLDEVSKEMQYSRPKFPIGFFLSQCALKANFYDEKPDNELTKELRAQKAVFDVETYIENRKKAPKNTNSPAFEAPASPPISYMDQVRANIERDKKFESPSLKKARSIDVEKEMSEAAVLLQASASTNPFAKILLDGWAKNDIQQTVVPQSTPTTTDYGFKNLGAILDTNEAYKKMLSSLEDEKDEENIYDPGGFDSTVENQVDVWPSF